MHARTRRNAAVCAALVAGLVLPPAAAGQDPDCSAPARADMYMLPWIARAGALQRLTAERSVPAAPCAATFGWDLDDDGQFDDASGREVEAAFPAGRSRVSVRVVDAAGRASVARRSFPVNARNIRPVVSFVRNPYAPVGGQAVKLSPFVDDLDGFVPRLEWNLDGDDDFEREQTSDPWANSFPDFHWAFPAGPSRIALRGYDDAGDSTAETDHFTLPSDSSQNDGPETYFAGVPTLIRAGHPVSLEGYFSDPDTGGLLPPEATTWDLDGDGAFDDATGRSVTWTFPAGPPVTLSIRAVDAEGAQRVLSAEREIIDVPLAPGARFESFPAEVDVGETASLWVRAASPVTLPAPLDLAWDVDADGEFDDATGPNASVAFASPGAREISLRVTDPDGAFVDETRTIHVLAPPPPDDGDDDGEDDGGSGTGTGSGSGSGTANDARAGDGGTPGAAASSVPPAAVVPAARPGMGLRMRVGRQRLRDVTKRGVRVRLLARRTGTVRLTVTLEAGLARRLGISREAGSLVVVLHNGAERIVRVKLTRTARRALRRANPRTATLNVTARPTA